MVGNAHLDPAWLWTWQAGVDEAIATCRTACDLLDEYPDLHITRGEAWVYFQVQRLDPKLFARMKRYVRAERLHVVNGWWIQPDCNLPLAESFLKQSEVGGRYFRENLGVTTTIGYNVDSFGHCAMLPTFLRQGGKDAYVFTRPGVHEMTLPASLFRWESPAGDKVTAYRVQNYGAFHIFEMKKNIEAELAAAQPGAGHAMCFYGIGDHGGGPTRDQVEWIADHKNYAPGVELRFSHPAAFFAAVKNQATPLPIVTGELNPHAVGCYTVVRDIKREVRRAETMLLQAQALAAGEKTLAGPFEEAWRTLLFNQFHDVMGGSSVKVACTQSLEELGAVKAIARDVIVRFTRKATVKLPRCPRQRIVIDNPTSARWNGHVEFAPWFQPDGSPQHYELLDQTGIPVPFQSISLPYPSEGRNHFLFPVDVPGSGRSIIEIRRRLTERPADPTRLILSEQTIANGAIAAELDATGIRSVAFNDHPLLGTGGIRICSFEDNSDTWSHGVLHYGGPLVETLTCQHPWSVLERGPIRAAMHNTLQGKDGKASWVVQLLERGTALQMKLRLNWWGHGKIVKLIVPPGFKASTRHDGTPGAITRRPLDGREYPIADILSLAGEHASLTFVSPDVYSADCAADGTMRVTLLRSPAYAHHHPSPFDPNSPLPVTDQGVHEYEIELIPDEQFHEERAVETAYRMNYPLWLSETTDGMPSAWKYDSPPKHIPASMPPVAPNDALLPASLLDFAGPTNATIVPSGELCDQWPGEQLLVSNGPTLTVNLPIAVGAKYRLRVARLAGKGFGQARVLLAGQPIATLSAGKGRPIPADDFVGDLFIPEAGAIDFEFKASSGNRVAVAFVHLEPVYVPITTDLWSVAGPFLYAEPDSINPLEGVDAIVVGQEYPPERSRDFNEPISMGDGSTLNWLSVPGNDDFINFAALTGKKAGSIHYAVTHIWSDARRSAKLSFGTDFWTRIWLNGELIAPLIHGCGAPFKGQLNLTANLEQGWNELMLKVASGQNGNGFWMAVSDSGALRFSARPGAK